MWSGVLLVPYYFEAEESNLAIDQQKPGLKSMAHISLLFYGCIMKIIIGRWHNALMAVITD